MICQQCGKTHTRCDGHKASDRTEPCQRYPRKGSKVCDSHGGKAPQVKARAEVRAEVERWGLGDTTVDPGETLLRLVSQSARRVDRYSRLLEEAYDAAERLRTAQNAPEQSDLLAEEKARLDLERVLNHGGVAALVGHTYAGSESGVIATGEAIRGLAQLEAQERDRLANFAGKAIAAGLAERQVRLAERQGAMLAAVIAGVVRALGKDPADPEVQRLVQLAISSETGVGPAVIEGKIA